jgi:hypothetical protein
MLERSRRTHLAALLGCLLAFLAMCMLAPSVTLDVRLAYGLAFLLVSGEIVLVSRVAPAERPLALLAVVVLSVALLLWQRGAPVTLLGSAAVALALLLGPTALGTALGVRIERPGHLLAVAAISAVADLWSVYDPAGLSARMAKQAVEAPDTMMLFALPWPMLGTRHIEPIIGAGDVLFSALYLGAYERHGLALKRAAVGLFIAYALGLVAILITERPVPLLPLLGAAAVLADARTRSLPPHEKRTVLVMLAVLGAVLAFRFLR